MTNRDPDTGLAHLIKACLLGGAIGDALGADIEFASLAQILRRFPKGFENLPRHDGIKGAITDDTQMTLFTAEGLIRASVRYEERGICDPASVVHHALLRWLSSQGSVPKMEVDGTGLICDRRLHARRAPGNTCLSSLQFAKAFGDLARNDSKGCGTIMRVAPMGFVAPDSIRDLAMETSALTHGHPTGQEAAAAWALILAALITGTEIEKAATGLINTFDSETDQAIRLAIKAPRDGAPETVESLGGGWIAEEALSIALYACLCARNFEHGLTIAVTHSGDSDSTGAIAGNALGLIFPDQVCGHRWARQVECADLIEKISRDLALAVSGPAEKLGDVYPGC
ncbi:ADP-ribosylglycohydrolase family protein [Pseudotabrizicola sediminis]|uniref:ADP-ribosylglycohydrolase family protein n=1 Tax=Pseudotabrizicola sediminis TaxID=2486418 RepID=A0ABY2KGT2_9RHOB|nr:ADP-ribosylglycohydrolase family protein [Pseudotabrizicola sediminis]TGD41443.1 ADP-ribosylglycohydrolase family protein [Pseudotabrizicola sediminis]